MKERAAYKLKSFHRKKAQLPRSEEDHGDKKLAVAIMIHMHAFCWMRADMFEKDSSELKKTTIQESAGRQIQNVGVNYF
jgi:hypothetical protein